MLMDNNVSAIWDDGQQVAGAAQAFCLRADLTNNRTVPRSTPAEKPWVVASHSFGRLSGFAYNSRQ
jgi:hypothetical protein